MALLKGIFYFFIFIKDFVAPIITHSQCVLNICLSLFLLLSSVSFSFTFLFFFLSVGGMVSVRFITIFQIGGKKEEKNE